MSAKKSTAVKVSKDVENALSSLGPVATLVGKSAGVLWKIFVRKYVAQGVAELAAGIGILWGSVWLLGDHNLWLFFPAALTVWFVYMAIQHLINPYYSALDDVLAHVKNLDQPKTGEMVAARPRGSY